MTKYLCLCGETFKKKKEALHHVNKQNDEEDIFQHFYYKETWKGRLEDILLDLPLPTILRGIGMLVMYYTILHHFHIDLTMTEATLMGLGMGLVSIK
jgi:hypothetical protein